MQLVPVILCGGVGSRLWPLSREALPKQFLSLLGDRTLLLDTLHRVEGLSDLAPPLLMCNEQHRFLVAEQVRRWRGGEARILLEPEARNTAPAIAVAALRAIDRDPDAVLLVLPADHALRDVRAFHAAVGKGLELVRDGYLATFGIVPLAPETGYGYIRTGEPAGAGFRVAEFVEKPDLTTARRYLASGEYLWNSGMFLFSAAQLLTEMQRHAPDIAAACRAAMRQSERDRDFLRIDGQAFAASPAISIDYAVMEKTDRAAVVPLDAGWSDVGSWASLAAILEPDAAGNVMRGDVIGDDNRGCYVQATDRLVAVLGLRDQVIVETSDAVLIASKDRVQEVRQIVARLDREGRPEGRVHKRVYRPWGSYETVDAGERFQVKRIVVNPSASLSLQLHHHRAEHWVVVRGTARITRGDDSFVLTEDQSTYIPLGTRHRLENPGKIPLELIEVQSGSYLGEDDIQRFEDQYGR